MAEMDVPTWIQQAVHGFGEAMQLRHFALNAQGVAGVRLETGAQLRLELRGEELCMLLLTPAGDSVRELQELLTAAHPRRQRGPWTMHVAYRDGQAIRLVKLPSEAISRPQLEAAFRELWSR